MDNWSIKKEEYNKPEGFVQINEKESKFILNNDDFYFVGANCYYLMVFAAESFKGVNQEYKLSILNPI